MNSGGTDPLVLIIGYGNPLRGDDGLGHVAAQRLYEALADERVELHLAHQLMPEISEPVSRARLVIFIDASAADPPGEVVEKPIAPADAMDIRDTHELGPSQLLATAKTLFGRSAEGVLFSVGAADFELRESLSPQAAAGVEVLLNRAAKRIRDFLASANPL